MLKNRPYFQLILFFQIFAGAAYADATDGSYLIVKGETRNLRKSPSAENDKNLIPGCQLKSGQVFQATDFEYVDGAPWCKLQVDFNPNCPQGTDLWVKYNAGVLREIPENKSKQASASSNLDSSTAAAAPCTNCSTPATSATTNLTSDIQNLAIEFSSPLKMSKCLGGDDCNCRGPSSRWNMTRRHPISGRTEPHQGIDIGAPKGEPVYAAADGVVSQLINENGYGRRIFIKHFDNTKSVAEQLSKTQDDNYDNQGEVNAPKHGQLVKMHACGIERAKTVGSITSTYNHLSKYAESLIPGKIVKKGDLIGYVGSLGKSTGPHLHFEIEVTDFDCHVKKSGNTCDPELVYDFDPDTPPGTKNYHCEGKGGIK
jgi:murein DD-endopeptidase MepM/ murein hydrolase activator NlpD